MTTTSSYGGEIAMDQHQSPAEGPAPQPLPGPPPDVTARAVPPPGWYLDPTNAVALRFWDGVAWTANTSPIPPPTSAPVELALETPHVSATTPDAQLATQAAVGAAQMAEQTAQAAMVAVEAAKEAAKEAKEAAQAAEVQTQAAEHATQVAADAAQVAQQIEQAVSKARAANTPEAWREAAQLAVMLGATDEPLS